LQQTNVIDFESARHSRLATIKGRRLGPAALGTALIASERWCYIIDVTTQSLIDTCITYEQFNTGCKRYLTENFALSVVLKELDILVNLVVKKLVLFDERVKEHLATWLSMLIAAEGPQRPNTSPHPQYAVIRNGAVPIANRYRQIPINQLKTYSIASLMRSLELLRIDQEIRQIYRSPPVS
jgi:hypothetical protein